MLCRCRLLVTLRTVTHQVPLSVGFSRQGYWSGLSFPSSRAYWPRDRIRISCVSCTGRRVLYHERHLGSPSSVCWVFLFLILATVDDHSKPINPRRVENNVILILTLILYLTATIFLSQETSHFTYLFTQKSNSYMQSRDKYLFLSLYLAIFKIMSRNPTYSSSDQCSTLIQTQGFKHSHRGPSIRVHQFNDAKIAPSSLMSTSSSLALSPFFPLYSFSFLRIFKNCGEIHTPWDFPPEPPPSGHLVAQPQCCIKSPDLGPELASSQTDLRLNALNTSIQNTPKVETTQTSIHRWPNRQHGEQAHDGMRPPKKIELWHVLAMWVTLKTGRHAKHMKGPSGSFWQAPRHFRRPSDKRICLPVREMPETKIWSLSQADTPEEGMATLATILVWRIPWTREPDGLQSLGSQRVRHNWTQSLHIPASGVWGALLLCTLTCVQCFADLHICTLIGG